jgi:hypothetical protein
MEHDGLASQRPGLRLVDGADVQPWHLLVVLNEKFYIIDRFARPLFAYHFEQLQHRLATKLLPDCATSLLETLISVYNEPLISALASYERVERLENGSPWSNQQRWAAIRALLVATESETRRWFKKDSLFDVFLELFPGDKTSIGWQKCWHKFLGKHSLAAKKLDSTDKFCALLYDTMAVVEERGERQVERLDYHILVVNFSRNWSAHNGLNPPPNTAYLGTGVLTSVMRTLFIAWEACRHRPENKENLYKIYPGTAQGF